MAGLFSGAAAFDRPSVVSKLFLARKMIFFSNKNTPNIFVPKLVFDRQEDRYLSFREGVCFHHHFSIAFDGKRAVRFRPALIVAKQAGCPRIRVRTGIR